MARSFDVFYTVFRSSTMIAAPSPAPLQMAAGYSPLAGPMSPYGAQQMTQHGSPLNLSAMGNMSMSMVRYLCKPFDSSLTHR